MKFLEAQNLTDEQKQAGRHENKMSSAPQNKSQSSSNKNPQRSGPTAHDDATALAKSLNVDMTKVTGTGPNGSVLPRDVRKASEEQTKAKTNSSSSNDETNVPVSTPTK